MTTFLFFLNTVCTYILFFWVTGLAVAINLATPLVLTYSGFNFLSPPRTTVLSNFSRFLASMSSSFSLNSSAMISRSLTGSMSPSMCVTSSSSNAPETPPITHLPKATRPCLTAQMEDGVAGADVTEEGIAQSLSLRRSLHQAGYVDDVQEGRDFAADEKKLFVPGQI
jgi:hypothetical protein